MAQAATPRRQRTSTNPPPPPSAPPPSLPPPPPSSSIPFSRDQDFLSFDAPREGKASRDDSPLQQRAVAGRKRKRGEVTQEDARSRDIILARGTPWAERVPWDHCRNAAEMLHQEILAFDEWMSPTRKEHQCRVMVIELIRRAIRSMWPDSEVHTFGSQDTQLYLPQGDIDLVVLSAGMESSARPTVLRQIAALLRRRNLTSDVQVIAHAKVPIVKFVCLHGRYHVDISLNLTNGITAAKYVNRWLSHEPALRPLVMVLKQFLSQRGLSEVFSGGLGSYSIILMCISFLQLHPKIQRGEIDAMENLGVLLVDMLELYGLNFGYDATGISVSNGGYVPKTSMACAPTYQRGYQKGGLVSIEDPQDPSNDISRGSFNMSAVRSAIEGVYGILTGELCRKGNELASRRRHRLTPGSSDEDPDEAARRVLLGEADTPSRKRGGAQDAASSLLSQRDPRSLLGTFLGISPQVVRARRQVQELYDSGTLQSILGREVWEGEEPEAGPSSVRGKRERARSGGGSWDPKRESGVVADSAHEGRASRDNTAIQSRERGRERSSSVEILDEDELAQRNGVAASSWGDGGGGGPEYAIPRLSQSQSQSRGSTSQPQSNEHSQEAVRIKGKGKEKERREAAIEQEPKRTGTVLSIRGSAAAAAPHASGNGSAAEPFSIDEDDEKMAEGANQSAAQDADEAQDSRYHVVAGAGSSRGTGAQSRAASVVSVHSTAPSSFVSDDSDRESHDYDSDASASREAAKRRDTGSGDGIMLPTISDGKATTSRAARASIPPSRRPSEKSLKRLAFWNAKGNVDTGRDEVQFESREDGGGGRASASIPKKARRDKATEGATTIGSRREPIDLSDESVQIDNTPYRTGALGWTDNTPDDSSLDARTNGTNHRDANVETAFFSKDGSRQAVNTQSYGMRARSVSPDLEDVRSSSPYHPAAGIDDTTFQGFDMSHESEPKMPNSNRKLKREKAASRTNSVGSSSMRAGDAVSKGKAKSKRGTLGRNKYKEAAIGSSAALLAQNSRRDLVVPGQGKGKAKAARTVNTYGMAVVPTRGR